MPPIDTEGQFKFLLCCIKHSSAGRVNFDSVASELKIVSKAAAAKRYERLLKAHNITVSSPRKNAASKSAVAGGDDADEPKTPSKKRKRAGAASAGPKKENKETPVKKEESDIKEEPDVKNEESDDDVKVKGEDTGSSKERSNSNSNPGPNIHTNTNTNTNNVALTHSIPQWEGGVRQESRNGAKPRRLGLGCQQLVTVANADDNDCIVVGERPASTPGPASIQASVSSTNSSDHELSQRVLPTPPNFGYLHQHHPRSHHPHTQQQHPPHQSHAFSFRGADLSFHPQMRTTSLSKLSTGTSAASDGATSVTTSPSLSFWTWDTPTQPSKQEPRPAQDPKVYCGRHHLSP